MFNFVECWYKILMENVVAFILVFFKLSVILIILNISVTENAAVLELLMIFVIFVIIFFVIFVNFPN